MEKPFRKVTIVGAGTLGSQIAMLAADAGYEVVVFDTRPGSYLATLDWLEKDIAKRPGGPFLPFERWPNVRKVVRQVTDLAEAVKDADLVIEAVPEVLEIKRKVWGELGRLAPPHAVLASNSSSMPISYMEDAGGRPEKSLNLHFYMVMQWMNIVDVMGGTKTDPSVMERGIAFVRSVNCLPLRVNKEILGFCFNRVWRAVKKEVLHMWADGYADFRDIDRGWMIFTGMKEGPFGFMDRVGLDVVHDIEMMYYNASKDASDAPPQALKDMIARGETGTKSGKGFYGYPEPEYRKPSFLDPKGE